MEKINECRDLRAGQLLAVGRHVPSALNHLPHERRAIQSRADMRQIGSAVAADSIERVAVAARLQLQHHSALHFSGTQPFDDIDRDRITGPRIHVG